MAVTMHTQSTDTYDDLDDTIEVVGKLASKDLRKAAETLTHVQARFMVDTYYAAQDLRKAQQNRQRASIELQEPNELMQWSAKAQLNIEHVIKAAMDTYTMQHPLARWARSIPGIGPVIGAGLMAHLGGQLPPPTVGHWWSFAGLNPDTEWRGRDEMWSIIKTAYAVDGTDATAIVTIAETVHKYPERLYELAGCEALSREETQERLSAFTDPTTVEKCFRERPFETGAAVKLLCERIGMPRGEVYQYLYRDIPVNRDELRKGLTIRPWNARLKVLCFKIGESFVKVQNKPEDVYGKIYAERKKKEQEANGRFEYRDQAEKILNSKNFRSETIARAAYQRGQLPDAHIHARARRRAVKLFLAHFHEVAYFLAYGKLSPMPYAIAHIPGHVHRLFAPHAELIPGLEEAQRVA